MKMVLAAVGLTWLTFVPSTKTVSSPEGPQYSTCFQNNCAVESSKIYESISLDTRLKLIRSSPLKVVIVIASAGTEDVAGGSIKLENGTTVYLEGSGVPVIWDFRDSLDLTLDIVLSKNWEEAWELVESGKVELGSSLMTVTLNFGHHSFASVTKLLPLLSMPSMVYFRQPSSASKERRYAIFEPLESNTWKALAACWMLCVVMCHLIHRLPIRGEIQPRKTHDFSFSEILLWAATISSGKDYPANAHDPSNYQISQRIAMISAIILSVIVTAIYTAKIVVYFSRETSAVKKPDDLLKLGYEIGSWSNVHIDRLFQGSRFDEKRKAAAVNDLLNSSSQTIIKKLLGIQPEDIQYAYLAHPDGLFYLHDPEVQQYKNALCKVSTFSSAVKSARAMYMNKNSPHKEVLNWKILQLVERGINFRHQRNNIELFEHTCSNFRDPLEELTLQHTFFIFLIVFVGASIAMVVVVCEHVHHRVFIKHNLLLPSCYK